MIIFDRVYFSGYCTINIHTRTTNELNIDLRCLEWWEKMSSLHKTEIERRNVSYALKLKLEQTIPKVES